MSRGCRLLRAPALHFLVLGGALFALDAVREAPPPLLQIAAPIGRPPTDEELLLQEALALGIDRRDPLVRARLVALGRVAAGEALEDAAALERDARRLGLERHDLIVRRHLVHVMQLALAHGGPPVQPDDATLAAYVERHRARFVQPARVRFTHVFFARDRHGEPAAAAAARALASRGSAPGSEDARGVGDACPWGTTPSMSEPEIARRFGGAFAAALRQAPLGRWSGPVSSSYGVHVVRVDERTPERMPSFASVRSRALRGWLADEAAARFERRMAERRARAS
jgi:hypothetical protein